MFIRTYRRSIILGIIVGSISIGGYAGLTGAFAEQVVTPIAIKPVSRQALTVAKASLHKAPTPSTPTAPSTPSMTKKSTPSKNTSSAATAAAAPALVTTTIAKGTALYTSPDYTSVVNQAASSAGSSDAAVLARLATKPTAQWFGGWNNDVTSDVNSYVAAAQAVGRVPILVAYNIPFRDCGGESAGGASSANSYAAWIQKFANGVNHRSAIVILEPDAVAADCYDANRAAMLASAVKILQAAGASVYLDAGNPTWQTVGTMVSRLQDSGIDQASGFSLNVSNFQSTASNISYGATLSSQLNGKHFVIDTSRNGSTQGSGGGWCNPIGKALGTEPTTQTGNKLVDAYVWIKIPGESDGKCGSAIGDSQPPAAGTFWPAYALMLARGAGW